MRQRRRWLLGLAALVIVTALALWLLSLNAAQRGVEAQATAEQAAQDWCGTNVIVECPYECATAVAGTGTEVAPAPTECRMVCPPPTISPGECEFYYAVEQERRATLASRGTPTP